MNYERSVSLSPSGNRPSGWGALIRRLFHDYPGAFAIRLWNDETIFIGRSMPYFTLVFKSASVFRDAILRRDPLQLAHAYFSGGLDIEGDIYHALDLRHYLGRQSIRLADKAMVLAKALTLGFTQAAEFAVRQVERKGDHGAPTREKNRNSIAFHYDVPSEFYRIWLDEKMVYSCAYFENNHTSLADAQTRKLEHICRKLRLKPGEKMLDVGCGWGALAMHAARHHDVQVTGITLSRGQYEWARRRVREEKLEDRVTIELVDYRDVPGESCFDKVSSVGMFEHVGLKNLPTYFNTVRRLLKPGGLFLNHGITHDEEGWHKTMSTDFINRYVFPDGELDTVSNVQREMERAQFELWDVEGLRPHYALTLRHWVARLDAARDQALRYVDEATFRVWRLYMAGSALHFENGDIGIYQILASKREPSSIPVPLTRDDIYAAPNLAPTE